MQVFRSEIKVGLLILVSLVLLVAGIFMVSNLRTLWEDRKSYVLLFPTADGVTKGSPVWYAGLAVGEVTRVRIAGEANDRIAVTVRVHPDARVRSDSHVSIRSHGMMGAKYIEISPGSPDAPELRSGETIEGRSQASLSDVIETGRRVADHLVELVQETYALVREIRSESALKEAVQNAGEFLADLRDQGRQMRPVLKKLGTFADSLDETGKNLKRVSGDGGKELTALLGELRETNRGLQQKLESLEKRLDGTLATAGSGLSEAEGCVKDVRSMLIASEDDIAALLRHLKETARNLEHLSEDLRAHPWKIIRKGERVSVETGSAGTDLWREKGRIGPYDR